MSKGTSVKLFAFLKKEGALERFVNNCEDIHKFIANQESEAPDGYWNASKGGFAWDWSSEGREYWLTLRNKAIVEGVYNHD